MSKVSELSKTNSIATVDNYRYFVTCSEEDFKNPEKRPLLIELYRLFSTFPHSITFSLACELMIELDEYADMTTRSLLNSYQRAILSGLLNSFKNCQDIEREEYIRLLEVAPLYVVEKLINNYFLPLDFLLDSSFLERHESDPMFENLKKEFRDVIGRRKPKIAAYLRNMYVDYQHMTDEMVLSVAGIVPQTA